MRIFDQSGEQLGELPEGAIPATPDVTALTILRGKYIDADGIVYDANGTVNESATAAFAREQAARHFAIPGITPSILQQRADTLRQQTEADRIAIETQGFIDNVIATGREIPGRVINAVSMAETVAQWAIIGLVAYTALQMVRVLERGPRRTQVKYRVQRAVHKRITEAKRHVRAVRKRIARTIAGD